MLEFRVDYKLSMDQVILKWMHKWSNRFPKNEEDKFQEFTNFFALAEANGYEGHEHFHSSVRKDILYATVNEKYQHKDRLKTWAKMNTRILEQAFLEYFKLGQDAEERKVEYKRKYGNALESYGPTNDALDIVEGRPDLDMSKLPEANFQDTDAEEEFLASLERNDNE